MSDYKLFWELLKLDKRPYVQKPSKKVLDLHGYMQDEAYDLVLDLLRNSADKKIRVVTGKSGVFKSSYL